MNVPGTGRLDHYLGRAERDVAIECARKRDACAGPDGDGGREHLLDDMAAMPADEDLSCHLLHKLRLAPHRGCAECERLRTEYRDGRRSAARLKARATRRGP